MEEIRERLRALYHDVSKHSSYQNIPAFVSSELGYSETIDEEWRGDRARYEYLLTELDLWPGAIVGDVGANTGFFALSLGNLYKESEFIAYEANGTHVEFMQLIIDYFGLNNVSVRKCVLDLDGLDDLGSHHAMLHLNVLHHAGHDFDDGLVQTLKDFEKYALRYLEKLRSKTSIVFFQMGSNWGGNKEHPIVAKEDDAGKVILQSRLFLNAGWSIVNIAFATKDESHTTVYRNLPKSIVDTLRETVTYKTIPDLAAYIREYGLDQFRGEFYRRPVFVCEARQ